MEKQRVLILGGGFGGIYAALEFEKRRDPNFDVTLVSQDNFFLFSMDAYERLRQSEQSRRLAWQLLHEIRQVLEISGDQRIPYEGERKRFRSEGDFLVRARVDVLLSAGRKSIVWRVSLRSLKSWHANASCREMFFRRSITWPAGKGASA